MDCFNILAQSVQAAETSSQTEESIVPLQVIWGSITSLSVLEALTFIAFGVVCLLYGWRVFKILVIISFALLGLAVGLFINDSLGELNSPIICGVAGLIFLGILSVPLMKYGVSVLGAVAGGIVTAGIWYACSLPENYIWAGALVGVVAGGMISFIVFRVSIMLFSSLGGSSLIVVGLLALLYSYPPAAQEIKDLVMGANWFLPMALIFPAGAGVYFQNKLIKDAPNWSI